MSDHRPTAHRAFTVLIAVLLVGSIVAPALVAQPAAADSTTEEICSSPARFFQTVNAPCTTSEMLGSVDETESGAYLQSDAHANGNGVQESWESTYILTGNYLQDTPVIASLEGKQAIANSWENNVSQTNASDNVNESINEYYANLEVQILEEYSAHNAQMAYLSNQTIRDSDSPEDFFHQSGFTVTGSTYSYDHGYLQGYTGSATYTLSNGTSHDYETPVLYYESDGDWVQNESVWLSTYSESSGHFILNEGKSNEANWEGGVQVMNVPEFNLSSEEVYAHQEVVERLNEIESQRQTALNNFDPQMVDSMYTALDNGEITPEDLRGAEGMVRYLSGDSNVSEERYKIATHAVLDLEQPDLNMTMKVQYEGATSYEMVEKNGSRVRNYTDYVNTTYKGLLFSGETPTDGFVTGETYDTGALNGSQLIVTQNDTTHFYDGNFTIEKMFDGDGNEVDNASWENPDYSTYSSDEYVKLLEKIAEQQKQIEEQKEDEEDDSGINIGLPFDLGANGGELLGIGIIVLVVLSVVGFVTDQIPGLGN